MEFADDVLLLGASLGEVQSRMDTVSRVDRTVGLFLNHAKTVWVAAASVAAGDLVVDGVAVPLSDSLVYLGSTLNASGGLAGEVDRLVALASASFLRLQRLWRDRRASFRTKARVYVAVVRAVLLYAVETWMPREADV